MESLQLFLSNRSKLSCSPVHGSETVQCHRVSKLQDRQAMKVAYLKDIGGNCACLLETVWETKLSIQPTVDRKKKVCVCVCVSVCVCLCVCERDRR